MSQPNLHYSDEIFLGENTFANINLPPSCVSADNLELGADLPASSLRHRHAIQYGQKNGADVASETIVRHIAQADGDITGFVLRPTTVPSGGGVDKQYTVDVQKAADASGSWTSILTAVITVNSSSVANTKVTGTLATLTYSAGDAFRIVVTASGSVGTQAQGFNCILTLDEKAA